jgi:hypothetical protein
LCRRGWGRSGGLVGLGVSEVLVWGFLGVFDHTTVSFATWGCFLVDSQDLQPPLKGCKTSPMNGAGQPPASTFWRLPRSVKRSSLVAMSIDSSVLVCCRWTRCTLSREVYGEGVGQAAFVRRVQYTRHDAGIPPPGVVCGDSSRLRTKRSSPAEQRRGWSFGARDGGRCIPGRRNIPIDASTWWVVRRVSGCREPILIVRV